MKACPHCAGLYADAQEICPHCGRKPGDPEGELVGGFDRSLEEGFGRVRRSQLSWIIFAVLLLLAAAGIAWFLR